MKKDFKQLEPFRVSFDSEEFKSLNTQPGQRQGAFTFLTAEGVNLSALVEIADGWEHVSVSGQRITKQGSKTRTVQVTPTWDDMNAMRWAFFEEEEDVFQFHPALSKQASAHDATLHLWRPADGREIPMPPEHLVNYTGDLWDKSAPVKFIDPNAEQKGT